MLKLEHRKCAKPRCLQNDGQTGTKTDRHSHKLTDGQTDSHKKLTDGQTSWQMGRQAQKLTDRQTGTQIDR